MSDAPKIIDAPATIWLNYGDIERDCTHVECYRDGDVTWCQEPVFDSDVKYVRADASTLSRVAELERKNAALQARIDELMLEHCPDEMTQEQIDNYAKHQQPVDAETEAAIDAAIAREKENERG